MNEIKVFIADDHPVFLEGLGMMIGANKTLQIVGRAADGETPG